MNGPYPARAIVKARKCREVGWSYEAIRGLIEQEFGRKPTRPTVEGWVDERLAERRRRLVRTGHRRRRGVSPNQRISVDLKAERMVALLDRGLSVDDISTVAEVCWGEAWEPKRIRKLLGLGSVRVA